MSNQLLELLRLRRAELDEIGPSVNTWSKITEWHSRTRPLVAQHFGNQLDAFDDVIKIQWTSLPRMISVGRKSVDYSRTDAAERSANNAKVQNAKGKLLSIVDALIELWELDGVFLIGNG